MIYPDQVLSCISHPLSLLLRGLFSRPMLSTREEGDISGTDGDVAVNI